MSDAEKIGMAIGAIIALALFVALPAYLVFGYFFGSLAFETAVMGILTVILLFSYF